MSLALALVERLKILELPLRRFVLPDRFHRVEVETTSCCNRRCRYCPVSYRPRPPHQMEEALFLSILDQLGAMGFRGRFSPHFYGEPLLDRRMPGLVREVRRRVPGAMVVVYTNGDLLDSDTTRELLGAGVGLFIATWEDEEPPALRQTRAALGPVAFRSHFVVRQFSRDVASPYNRGGKILFPHRELHMKACLAAASKVVVDAWGKVKLCSNDYFGQEDWGDLHTVDLAGLWRRSDYREARRELLRGVFRKRVCRECVGIEDPSEPLATHA